MTTSTTTRSSSSSSSSLPSSLVLALGGGMAVTTASYYLYYHWYHNPNAEQRKYWYQEEEEEYGQEALPSVMAHFQQLTLSSTTTVEEANRRRTVTYYFKAREAHLQTWVVGIACRKELQHQRRHELQRIFQHYHATPPKSHRTVIVMCDKVTAEILEQARTTILQPLDYSHDIHTTGVWIPECNMIPPTDMHVTVAIPWWWHTIRDNNTALSQALVQRLKQALVLDFHHAFQIELERIILLGGKTLVALWRCVGERVTEDGTVVHDRHGETVDPMVKLRREIVKCFTTENEEIRRQPLTYAAHKQNNHKTHYKKSQSMPVLMPKPEPLTERKNSIEEKTPGIGQGDGFIHTTLCRLPLDCLSASHVDLEDIHRLCREATATYCGHRMVVSKYRFLETTGKGGESNPCVDPLFDETVQAPPKVVQVHPKSGVVVVEGGGNNISGGDGTTTGGGTNSHTIGAMPDMAGHQHIRRNTMEGLFDEQPPQEEEIIMSKD